MSNNIIQPLITKRKSILSFSNKKIDEKNIQILFEAARWAPSSYNAQPWRFVIARKAQDKIYDEFYSLLMEGNRIWAETAPILVLSVAEVKDYMNRPNRFAFHDLGMAVGNLLIQATSMGLFVHQMGGYDFEAARKLLNIPENFEPAAIMAIGYRGEIANLPDELKKREKAKRVRKEIAEFVFHGKWIL
ncbi:MAG: nitroreductase family protein [Bacteroidales bacterium]|nr:nitroreductase family protein [Bacteroidales bacterium]